MALQPGEETVVFEVEVRRASEKALLCSFMDPTGERGPEFWIPRSQISADSEVPSDATGGEIGPLTISKWIAEQKGLPLT